MTLDEAQLKDLVGRFTADLATALHAATVVAGHKLGLFQALAHVGPASAATVATAAGCDEALVEQWLNAQFLAGYCQFSPQTSTYWMSPEQQAVLGDPSSRAFLLGSAGPDPGRGPRPDREPGPDPDPGPISR